MPRRPREFSLPAEAWPEEDRRRWVTAHADGDIFGAQGGARHWRPKTAREAEKKYGLWLGCLARHGCPHPSASPGAPLTRENLEIFKGDLTERGLSPWSVISSLRHLSMVILALDPGADRSLLLRGLRELERRAPKGPRRLNHLVSPEQLIAAGFRRMEAARRRRSGLTGVHSALRAQDGLLMAFLPFLPARIGAVAAMTIDDLEKIGERYGVRFTAAAMKNARPYPGELPAELTPWLDHHLAVVRPTLLRGACCDALWLSNYRGAMSEQTMRLRFLSMLVGSS